MFGAAGGHGHVDKTKHPRREKVRKAGHKAALYYPPPRDVTWEQQLAKVLYLSVVLISSRQRAI